MVIPVFCTETKVVCPTPLKNGEVRMSEITSALIFQQKDQALLKI
jgi:hypothetical protein